MKAAFTQAMALNPNLFEPHYLFGRANRSDDPMNFYAACALVRAGYPDEALSCLERACQLGWNHLAWMENDPELESIRHTKWYQSVRSRLAARLPALP